MGATPAVHSGRRGKVRGWARRRRAGRWQLLSVVSGVAFVALVFAVLVVASGRGDRADVTGPGVSSEVPAVDGEAVGCDGASSVDEVCAPLPVVNQDTFDGAVERFQAGVSSGDDVRFLLLGVDDWETFGAAALGSAQLVPGGPADALPGAAASGGVFGSWQQEWHGGWFTVVEQLVVFDDAAAANAAYVPWRQGLLDAGLRAFTDPAFTAAFPDGSLGDESFTTAFSDPSAASYDPVRVCALQTSAQRGRSVLVVTMFAGGDCLSARPSMPASLVRGLSQRLDAIFPA